jgi:hypothetical protein
VEEDEVEKFERLLEKLIKENKIDRLEILKKLASSSAKESKDILEERDSQISQDMLLDDHIMNEQDS